MQPTEWRILYDKGKTVFEEYIDSVVAGDIKNLTIKEEWFMLEKYMAKKEEYVAKLEELKSMNTEELVEAKLLEVKEQIRANVLAEHEAKIKHAEEKVSVIDEIIAEEEASEAAKLSAEIEANNDANNNENNEYIGG